MDNFRQATLADVMFIAPRVRKADREEARASVGCEPEVFLPLTFTPGRTWTIVSDEGEPMALYGVEAVPLNPELGIVWMVATDTLVHPKNQRKFLKLGPVVLDQLHELHPLLGNYVDARNTTHIRWLKWMGFSFLKLLPEHGPQRLPFIQFARLKPCA